MKKIAQFGTFSYFTNGSYIPRTDQFYVSVLSQFENTKNPEELRKVVELTLTGNELDSFITSLQNIRLLKQQEPRHEEYGWIKGKESTV